MTAHVEPKTRTGRWTEAEGRKAVTAWKENGQPLARFAREHEVAPWRLRWWAQRLGELQGRPTRTSQAKHRSTESIDLIPAVVRPLGLLDAAPTVLVRLQDGIVVEMRSVEDVARLVAALRKDGV